MRLHSENHTADDTDALQNTQLDQLEAGGQLDIFALSTQADSVLTITMPGQESPVQSVEIPQETRAIRPTDDIPISLAVLRGGHPTVNIDIVTAATVQFLAVYRKRGEDF